MENVSKENMNARIFYEKSIVNQMHMVNGLITCGMKEGNPVVKLTTQLYVKISDELRALGWEEEVVEQEMYEDENEGVSWLHPISLDGNCSFTVLSGEHVFISAEEFYEATLKNQYKDLCNSLEYSIRQGHSEVKLPYKAYPAIIAEMAAQDWEHDIWYADLNTKEECSMFYPLCGFEEEE